MKMKINLINKDRRSPQMKVEQFLKSLKSTSQWFALYALALAISITLILSSCGRNEASNTPLSETPPQTRDGFAFENMNKIVFSTYPQSK